MRSKLLWSNTSCKSHISNSVHWFPRRCHNFSPPFACGLLWSSCGMFASSFSTSMFKSLISCYFISKFINMSFIFLQSFHLGLARNDFMIWYYWSKSQIKKKPSHLLISTTRYRCYVSIFSSWLFFVFDWFIIFLLGYLAITNYSFYDMIYST